MTTLDEPAGSTRGRVYEPADRYRVGARPVLLTGVQAIARTLAEQHARDALAAKRTATFVSGYPGSPLAGLDRVLHGLPQLRTDHDVHLVPGLNEDLAATAVWGSQRVLGTSPYDGVVGVWYGKGPGVDRSGDALRHGNTFGANAGGGVLVFVGDDPAAKSSSIPCATERTLASFGLPVLAPRDGSEVVAFGLWGVALSRLSGCFASLKIVADVADGVWTVDRDFASLPITLPELEWQGRPWRYVQRHLRDPRDSVAAEADLLGPRWAAVQAFEDANPLNEIAGALGDAWFGIAAVGTAYDTVLQTLRALQIAEADLVARGIRLLRVGMPYPLGAGKVRRFAAGLQQLLVVEEKSSFVEAQVKELLYGVTGAPLVVGKRDADTALLVPPDGQLTAERLEPVLRAVLAGRLPLPPPTPAARPVLTLTPISRAPHFCSGCPHNRSTAVPDGSLAMGGIGCHALVTMADRSDTQVVGLTHMGGEGAQWIGQAPFTDTPHLFQNMGDGTFFHSGQLAVQACVAAGVNITFKVLYNRAVAMTGAQHAEGGLEVPPLTRKLAAEGVARTAVVTDDPRKYRRVRDLAPGVRVHDRSKLDEVQRELREIPGVTVLIYDQQCANEARRLRKRGKLPVPTTRVVIDELTCEGCGDCGRKSNCLSVQPVETEFGRKTRIDQTSCNTDYSCLDGDCPSFLTVELRPAAGSRRAASEPPVAPGTSVPDVGDVLLAGIGGTGIVTVNQMLATAALRDGRLAVGLDQVGLSQKAGPVTSHLRIGDRGRGNRVGTGVDTLLAFDLVVASDARVLAACSPQTTVAVVSTSTTPTGRQVADVDAPAADVSTLLAAARKRVARLVELDAVGAAERLFGSTAPANLLLVGAAYQLGALPVGSEEVEAAIELNGVAVESNVAAFRWGRVAVADPSAFARAVGLPLGTTASLVRRALGDSPLAGETRRLVELRAALVASHSGPRASRQYVAVVERAWWAERALDHNAIQHTEFSQAVAKGIAHLWAYKDEYEVARLLTRPDLMDAVRRELPDASKVSLNLHPPALRALGLSRKIRLGPATQPALRLLARGRVLRGTPLDPFARSEIRRIERTLLADHLTLVQQLTASLSADSYSTATAAAAAALLVRGYEEVKLASVERYRAAVTELIGE